MQALNTLFEALITLARTMAPFTPFLTENMYQGLKKFLPLNSDGNEIGVVGGDDRSIHFLEFPRVKNEYFDPIIERAVSRMQSVISLGRNIRETKNVPLKVSSFLTRFLTL